MNRVRDHAKHVCHAACNADTGEHWGESSTVAMLSDPEYPTSEMARIVAHDSCIASRNRIATRLLEQDREIARLRKIETALHTEIAKQKAAAQASRDMHKEGRGENLLAAARVFEHEAVRLEFIANGR